MKEKDLTLWKQNGCFAQSAEIKQGYRYGKIQNWKTFPYIVQNANRKHWLKQKNYKWLLSKSQTHKTQSRWTSEYVISQFVGSFLVGYKFVKQTPTIIKKRCFGWAVLLRLNSAHALQTRFEFGGITLRWSDMTSPLLIKSSDYLWGSVQKRGWPAKKILVFAWGFSIQQVEATPLQCSPVLAPHCRGPPPVWIFKNSDWR